MRGRVATVDAISGLVRRSGLLADCGDMGSWIAGLLDCGIVGLLDGWMAGFLDCWITGSLDRWIGQFLRFTLWSKMRSGDLEEKGLGGVCVEGGA